MAWFAQAPANIALIKYMGKSDPDTNLPNNSSLSYILNDLLSFCEISTHPSDEDFWEPLDTPGAHPFNLSQAGQERYLAHLAFMKDHFNYEKGLIVRSCNNFQADSGMASSASSFAALTLCAVRALTELTGQEEPPVETIAKLSRHGSGSSCRSFFSPWALWTGDTVQNINLPYPDLFHHAIIVSHEQKPVPSSEAHLRITTSEHFAGRTERAEANLKALLEAFDQKNWREAHAIVWRDFQDMHQLFETSHPPFRYMTEKSQAVLDEIENFWKKHDDGPLVTMDAGPNIHLLFRQDQSGLSIQMKQLFMGDYDVI